MANIATTFGALLLGAIFAAIFSGIVVVQVFVYFKFYPQDSSSLKGLVLVVWMLDVCHMAFVSMSLWDHFIQHFGNTARIDFIPWSLALTIAFTAILTFLVHCFYVQRIYKLSRNNLYITTPIAVIVCLRLAFACVTTIKMIELRSLAAFVKDYTWSFTLGLALSSFLDVIITVLLCTFLMEGRKKNINASIHHILDSLMLYAFETGSLTCAATVVSMICWIVMPHNLVFMGLHFVISKFYANSLLATLNTRKSLTTGYGARLSVSGSNGDRGLPMYGSDLRRLSRNPSSKRISHLDGTPIKRLSHLDEQKPLPGHLQIKVEEMTIRTVDHDSDHHRTVDSDHHLAPARESAASSF